jgi:hypothetical protein
VLVLVCVTVVVVVVTCVPDLRLDGLAVNLDTPERREVVIARRGEICEPAT